MFKSFYNWGERWYECTPIMDTSRLPGGHSSVFDVTGKKLERNTSSYTAFGCEPRPVEYKHHHKVHVSIENTYQLDSSKKFSADRVKVIIDRILNINLIDRKYDGGECVMLTKQLSDEIKLKVKELNFKRYKIICQVIIGEKDQAINISSRFLWDNDRDNFASAKFENHSLYAVGMVYGIYFE